MAKTMSYNALMIKLQKMQDATNQQQMQFNREEASTARDWQTQMSNTAHQREVKDLKKAGLNPVLSTNSGGAMSYTTSSASASPESGTSALASVYGAHTSALATRAAASTSAAATRYAANMSYAAADRAASAAEYQANMAYETKKYEVDNSRNGSLFGTLGSWLKQSGLSDQFIKDQQKGLQVFMKGRSNLADSIKSNKGQLSYAQVDKTGRNFVDSFLRKINVRPLASTRNMYLMYLYTNDKKYLNRLLQYRF